jgi:hypothetical protein
MQTLRAFQTSYEKFLKDFENVLFIADEKSTLTLTQRISIFDSIL